MSKDIFTYWPNPARDIVNLQIESSVASPALIQIFDAKGVCIKVLKENLVNGVNQVKIPISVFPKGVYQFKLSAENGLEKTSQVIKN